MNFFHTGIKEVHRRLRRQKNRLALGHARGVLEKAEIALGKACWRRLEGIDTPGAAEAMMTLRLLEGELADSTARIAELEENIKAQEAERDTARKDAQAALAKVEEERKPILQQEKEAQSRLAEQQNALREHDRRVAELDAEQLALLREHAQIHVDAGVQGSGAPVDSTRAREMRRREIANRRTAIPEKLAALKAGREAIATPLAELNAALREVRARLAELDRRARETREALAAKEKAVTAAIAGLHREIATTRRQTARIVDVQDEPYRLAGEQLSKSPEPPTGEGTLELFEEVQRQEQAVRSLAEMEATWLRESKEADKQDLRIFGFVGVTFCVLLALSLLLVFRSPPRRDYLPENTEAVVSLNVGRFNSGELAKALQPAEPDVWQQLWGGLVRKVNEVPGIRLDERVARITRAMIAGDPGDYLLVEMRPAVDMDTLAPALGKAGGFGRASVSGLVLYSKKEPDLAFAQIGPRTLALGTTAAVMELINVRVGISRDMRVDTTFLNEFQRLDSDSALRVMTLRPGRMMALADPILSADLLAGCQLLGLAVDLQPGRPVAAHFLIRAKTPADAAKIANLLRQSPEQALQLQAAGPNLFIEPPGVDQREQGVDWHFKMTSPAAKEFLERVSRMGLAGGERTVAVGRMTNHE